MPTCDQLGSVPVTIFDELACPDRYPRSSRYDPAWLLDLDMGPNPLWLLEDLARDLDLRPGMQVLDLGSGKGATSVFLAREYGVSVVDARAWVPDDGFMDGHHLLPEGATTFTKRLGTEVLQPMLAAPSPPLRR